MTINWVNRQYGLSIKIGDPILFEDRPAVIMSATNYLHVRFTDGGKPRTAYLHPTWHTTYPNALLRGDDHPRGERLPAMLDCGRDDCVQCGPRDDAR